MAKSLKVRKKVKIPARAKIGVAACPLDKGYRIAKHYFHYEINKADRAKIVKEYIRTTRSKAEQEVIFTYPEYKFGMFSDIATVAYFHKHSIKVEPAYAAALESYIDDMVAQPYVKGNTESDSEDEQPVKKAPVRVSPHILIARKIQATIMGDLETIEDAWLDGKPAPELDIYALMSKYELKTSTPFNTIAEWVNMIRQDVQEMDYISKKEQNARLKVLDTVYADAERYTQNLKNTRKLRKPKSKTADKQIAKLKYMQNFVDLRLTSINPLAIIEAMRLYTYNTKTRQLTEYVSDRREGLEVSGTSLKGFDVENSRRITLRKPQEFLDIVLKKTPLQIDKEWDKLTTKTSYGPNGRIGSDVILLRILGK